jgi:hypothetical protein
MLQSIFGNENDDNDSTEELIKHTKSYANDDLENSVLYELTKLDEALIKCPSCSKEKF